MLSDFAKISGPALVAALVAGVMFAVWVANRKRIAANTVGRAEEQARRMAKDAERDAETTKKEAILEAKEKAHDILVEAERQARTDRQQAATLEQTLLRRESASADRQTAIERLEKELASRDQALRQREAQTAAAFAKCEELVAQHKHERERVAGLTADEAK